MEATHASSRHRWARRFVVGGLLLGVLMGLLTWVQRKMLFPAYMTQADPRAGANVRGLERLEVGGGGGVVEAWFLPGDGVSAEHPGPVVLFAHGNGELIDYWPDQLQAYRRMGVSVLLPEYRGYGRSAGSPSEDAITEDFVAFYDQLVARADVDAARIVFHGRSLGGGAVCALARHRAPAALILMSTFTSVTDIAREAFYAPAFLIRDGFDNASIVAELDVPILVVHGRRDGVIPPAHAERNAAAAGVEVVWYDAGHNDCPSDWPDYFRRAERFFRGAAILP